MTLLIHPLCSIPVSILFLLAGCASDYSVEDPHLGESVRHTLALQTTLPNQGAHGLDGEKAEAAVRNYKEFQKIDIPVAVTQFSQ